MIEKYALWKVLAVLLESCGDYSVREMARAAKIGPSTSKACLDYMNSEKLLNKKVIGNTYQYSLNTKNPAARQIKNAYIVSMVKKALETDNSAGSAIFLCSNEEKSMVFIIGDINSMPRRKLGCADIVSVTMEQFDEQKRRFKDIITIR